MRPSSCRPGFADPLRLAFVFPAGPLTVTLRTPFYPSCKRKTSKAVKREGGINRQHRGRLRSAAFGSTARRGLVVEAKVALSLGGSSREPYRTSLCGGVLFCAFWGAVYRFLGIDGSSLTGCKMP